MAAMSFRSAAVKPFCTKAEKPPMKFTPQVRAAFSRVTAIFTGSLSSQAAKIMAMGVTEIRLLMIGIPYFFSMSSPVLTKCSAFRQTFS